MSSLPLRLRLLLLVAAIFGFLALAGLGQGLAQTPVLPLGTRAMETAAMAHPFHVAAGTLSARIHEGTYTVDGLVAELHLNYEVEDANYMYLFVPGIGTAVISAVPSTDALQSTVTLTGDEMSFTAGRHAFRVTGIQIGAGDGSTPATLYVYLDATAWRLSRRAMLGFGMTAQRPYAWPSAVAAGQPESLGGAVPVPSTLLPAATRAHRPSVPRQIQPVALHPDEKH